MQIEKDLRELRGFFGSLALRLFQNFSGDGAAFDLDFVVAVVDAGPLVFDGEADFHPFPGFGEGGAESDFVVGEREVEAA